MLQDRCAASSAIVAAADGTLVASWFQRSEGGTAIGFARFNWEWLTAAP